MRHLTALLLFLTSALAQAADSLDCAMQKGFGPAPVDLVIDAGTLLMNNKRVLLASIHTPNYAKHNSANELQGREAYLYLQQLVKDHGSKIYYEYDEQQLDFRGRPLIHAFFESGLSLQVALLRKGFAFVMPESPNLAHLKCYQHYERQARDTGLGIWSVSKTFPLIRAEEMTTANANGFRIVQGRLDTFEKVGSFIRLNVGPLSIRINQRHWKNFDENLLRSYLGKTLEVRGYIGVYKNTVITTLNDPSQIALVEDNP